MLDPWLARLAFFSARILSASFFSASFSSFICSARSFAARFSAGVRAAFGLRAAARAAFSSSNSLASAAFLIAGNFRPGFLGCALLAPPAELGVEELTLVALEERRAEALMEDMVRRWARGVWLLALKPDGWSGAVARHNRASAEAAAGGWSPCSREANGSDGMARRASREAAQIVQRRSCVVLAGAILRSSAGLRPSKRSSWTAPSFADPPGSPPRSPSLPSLQLRQGGTNGAWRLQTALGPPPGCMVVALSCSNRALQQNTPLRIVRRTVGRRTVVCGVHDDGTIRDASCCIVNGRGSVLQLE
jgi:hypothetical protein